MIYLELFWGFLKVGMFAFGGAYGAIPLIRDVVLSYGWVNEEILTDMIAVSESTPGPIMVNLATYVGSSQAGFFGALLATIAVVIPSFVTILLLTSILKTITDNRKVQAVLSGMKPCMSGIILGTGLFMIVRNLFPDKSIFRSAPDPKSTLCTAVLLLVFYGSRYVMKRKMSPIMLIVFSAVMGVIVF